jgi:hypothetical protein
MPSVPDEQALAVMERHARTLKRRLQRSVVCNLLLLLMAEG